jgi:hypothetical protein
MLWIMLDHKNMSSSILSITYNILPFLKNYHMSKVISVPVNYKGKTYWIEDPTDKLNVFAYEDKELTKHVKVNGKTLMFNTDDLDDKL